MDKNTYNRIRSVVAAAIGMVTAFSVLRDSWALAAGSVALGIIILYTARSRVSEVLHDERTRAIREKASNATLGLVTVMFAAIGLVLIATGNWGYHENSSYGYLFSYLALIIMSVNSFFGWYYGERLGG